MTTLATTPRSNPLPTQFPTESVTTALQEAFVMLAYHEQASTMRSRRFKDQSKEFLEDVYWNMVVKIVNKGEDLGVANQKAFLKTCYHNAVVDAIRGDIRSNRAVVEHLGCEVTWERDWTDGEEEPTWTMKALQEPAALEGFGYIDFAKWLKKLDKVEAEVFLQVVAGGASFTKMGAHFGRDEFWVRRVTVRLAKKFKSETGLRLEEVEGFVKEAMRKSGPVYPVQPVRE
jgi:DNA-directed RNA polymerase specialized sigma24 family protein